jgi:hypothetical protein
MQIIVPVALLATLFARSRSFAGPEPGVVTIGTIHGGARHT